MFSLLLVFASGVLVGGVAYRLYAVNTVTSHGPTPQRPRITPEEMRKHIVSDMRQKIKLDDAQVGKINQIMDQTTTAWDQIRDRLNAEGKAIHDRQWDQVRALMTPEQRPLFDQWRTEREAEREAERKRRQQQQKEGPPGPPPSR